MGTGPVQSALTALAIGFAALLALDWAFWKQGLAPRWWLPLRAVLTAIVVPCLLVGAHA
jgi:uncharacterized membrane protein YbhN (UPF0104 family)